METDLSVKYYYIVNSDLNMSKGKCAAQVSHVAMQLAQHNNKLGKAIILKSEGSLLRAMCNTNPRLVYKIEDAGLTEVPKGSLTCVGVVECKATKHMIPYLKTLKLL